MIKEAFPPGHFYSVIPDIENEVLNWEPKYLGIDYDDNNHIEVLDELNNYLTKFDKEFGIEGNVENLKSQYKYSLNNSAFALLDGRMLHYYLQKDKPKHYVEVGSGSSTLLALNTKEMFNLDLEIVCIEPYPSPHLIKLAELGKIKLIRDKVQNVDLSWFKNLSPNDIVFIDSSHVVKVNSDVLYEFRDILPVLKSGIRIHFHDIFLPYEYPVDWLRKGRFWNEQYFLYTFLQYNSKFKIDFCCQYARYKFSDKLYKIQQNTYEHLVKKRPLPIAGGSIWLKVK